MEQLASRQAADRLGVNIQKFHRLVAVYQVEPVLAVPGIRGAKFWRAVDIDRIAAALEDGDAA
jgi:hypothetical protein